MGRVSMLHAYSHNHMIVQCNKYSMLCIFAMFVAFINHPVLVKGKVIHNWTKEEGNKDFYNVVKQCEIIFFARLLNFPYLVAVSLFLWGLCIQ